MIYFFISLFIIEFIIDLIWCKKYYNVFSILKIIKHYKLDIGTYIFNTDNYDEYILESKHLDDKYILKIEEYYILKHFFNDLGEKRR